MKAVILAGGYGKRLMPLTQNTPKPMIAVAGRPIVEWQVLWLRNMGVRSIILLTGPNRAKLIRYVEGKKKRWGVDAEYLEEKTPLGTGGALRNAKKMLEDEESFLALNGDNITNLNAKKLGLGNGVASMALVPLRSTFGVAHVRKGMIERFEEKPRIKGYWLNAGVYLMNDRIFDYLPRKGSIEETAFRVLAERKLLSGAKFSSGYWFSINTIKELEEADRELKRMARNWQKPR